MANDTSDHTGTRTGKFNFVNPLIGNRLRTIRQKKDKNRSITAKQINVTLKELDAVENGEKSLNSEEIFILSTFFNVETNYFFSDLTDLGQTHADLKLNAHQANEIRRLFDSYLNLPSREMQKSLILLAESVANAEI